MCDSWCRHTINSPWTWTLRNQSTVSQKNTQTKIRVQKLNDLMKSMKSYKKRNQFLQTVDLLFVHKVQKDLYPNHDKRATQNEIENYYLCMVISCTFGRLFINSWLPHCCDDFGTKILEHCRLLLMAFKEISWEKKLSKEFYVRFIFMLPWSETFFLCVWNFNFIVSDRLWARFVC